MSHKEVNEDFSKMEVKASELRWMVKHQLELLERSVNRSEGSEDYETESYAKKSENDIRLMAIIPILVSILETTLQGQIVLYVNDTSSVERKLKQSKDRNAKYTWKEFEEIQDKKKTVAEIYFSKRSNSFQSLHNVREMYEKFANMDLIKIWGKEKYDQVAELLRKRHEIIHEFKSNNLTPTGVKADVSLVRACLSEIDKEFSEKGFFSHLRFSEQSSKCIRDHSPASIEEVICSECNESYYEEFSDSCLKRKGWELFVDTVVTNDGDTERTQFECECGSTLFEVEFETFCEYCAHVGEKMMRS